MNQEVTDFINSIPLSWQVEVSSRIREFIHQAIPEVQERMQYGKPHYLKNGKYAAVITTAKGWVSFTIFNATALEDADGLFEPGKPERRTVKIKEGQAVDYGLLERYLQEASASL